MAYPMQPLPATKLLQRTDSRSMKQNMINSPKGALVRPALANAKYFQRYHMLNDMHESLRNIASKIRRLRKDLRKANFGRMIISEDLEAFKYDYAHLLCTIKRVSATDRLNKMK